MHYTQVYNSHTVSENVAAKLQAMPKVEIHVHLEGSVDPQTSYEMAQRNGVELPASSLQEWQSFYKFIDFNHFIDVYKLAGSCLKSAEDYVMIVDSFMRQQVANNVSYSESFISTHLHKNLSQNELVEALKLGVQKGQEKYGTRVQFIPDISRYEMAGDVAAQRYVLDFCLAMRDAGIGVGMGIGGREITRPPELFRDIFADARREGLRVVAHAGETEGAASIWGALNALEAERIGHGVRATEDAALMADLRDSQVPIEVCPQSNYCLGIFDWDVPHPIRQLVDGGLNVTVNSDDPPMFATDLNNEYMTLAAQGFTFEELWQLNLNGLNATFLPENEKAVLRLEWQQWYSENYAAGSS